MIKNCKFSFFLFFAALFIFSCAPEEDRLVFPGDNLPEVEEVFVINEGAFLAGNGEVTYRKNDLNPVQNYFNSINERPLGDVFQSMSFDDLKGYLVLNNSNKIEIVNEEFTAVGQVLGLELPRYVLPYNNTTCYVTEWGADGVTGKVKVFNPSTGQVRKTINLNQSGPDEIYLFNDKIFVVNGGGYASDSTISIIDPTTNTVIESVAVGINPKDMVQDANGIIWVLTNDPWGSGVASIVRLNPNTYDVIDTISVPSNTDYNSEFEISSDKKTIYVNNNDKVFAINHTSNTFPTSALIEATDNIYGFNVHPTKDEVYVAEITNFSSNGTARIYDSTTGAFKASFGTGIGPNSFYFKKK